MSDDQRELGFGLCSLTMAVSSVKENSKSSGNTNIERKLWGV